MVAFLVFVSYCLKLKVEYTLLHECQSFNEALAFIKQNLERRALGC